MRPVHLHCKAPRAWLGRSPSLPCPVYDTSISNLQGIDLGTFSTKHLITHRGTAEM